MKKILSKIIGDRNFYRMVLTVAVPIMIQNGITNFVGLLDNIMVGSVGTEQMTGVAIVNQLLMVFNLSIFGAISGPGIFGAQFYGSGDKEGMRNTFRFKVIICAVIVLLGIGIFLGFGEQLIGLYLQGEGDAVAIESTLYYAKQYLLVMLLGLLPFGIEQIYTSSLRESGETMVPMVAGILAVGVNFVLNLVLIFGLLGFPKLGVMGAAVATVISRVVQALVVVIWTHRNGAKMYFIENAYETLRIPMTLVGQIVKKGFPLMANEILWSAGMAMLSQCYSMKGLDTVAALNINNTIANLFNVVFIALGSAVSIIVGQLLGAGRMEEAVDTDNKLIAFTVMSCFGMGGLLFLSAPLFPVVYNTTDGVKALATNFIRVSAVCMPLYGFAHATYFTLRSGGKTVITFLFDSFFVWTVCIPVAYVLSRYSPLTPVLLYFTCQSMDWIKCVIGFILVKKRVWVKRLVANAA